MKSKQDLHEDWASNRSYCQRLAELAFPAKIWIRGVSYDKDQLSQELAATMACGDRSLMHLLARRFFMSPGSAAADAFRLQRLSRYARFSGQALHGGQSLRQAGLENPKLQHACGCLCALYAEQVASGAGDARAPGLGTGNWRGHLQIRGAARTDGRLLLWRRHSQRYLQPGDRQGLAQLGLLPHLDYLSSVSGGGYIHEFLAAWILASSARAGWRWRKSWCRRPSRAVRRARRSRSSG